MFPKEIEDLIFAYLTSMNEGCDLPSMEAVRKLVSRSDVFTMNSLGFAMGIATNEMLRIRCRVVLNNDFIFYFNLSPMQRQRFIRGLKRGIVENAATASLVWLFLVGPKLNKYPEYYALFTGSLLIKFLSHFCIDIG